MDKNSKLESLKAELEHQQSELKSLLEDSSVSSFFDWDDENRIQSNLSWLLCNEQPDIGSTTYGPPPNPEFVNKVFSANEIRMRISELQKEIAELER